jgi:hypothetical protein
VSIHLAQEHFWVSTLCPHVTFKKISRVHSNGKWEVVAFVELSECRMGGEALLLLQILQLKDAIMEAMISKVFVEHMDFYCVGHIG